MIPNHNYGQFLGEGIESVLRQGEDIEVIVVDNGSSDSSFDVLNGFGSSIKVIRQSDLGQAAARNRGILESRGDFVAFLDADDFWYPGKLSAQLSAMASYHEASLVSCDVWRVDATGQRVEVLAQPKREVEARDFIRRPQVGWVLCGESTALIRRSALSRSGLLDTALTSASGWDLFRRLSKVGRLTSVDEPLAAYRLHGANTSLRRKLIISDMRYACRKARFEARGETSWVTRYAGGVSLARSIAAAEVLEGDYGAAVSAISRGLCGHP